MSNCRLGSVIHYSWEYWEESKLTQKCCSYLHLDKPPFDAKVPLPHDRVNSLLICCRREKSCDWLARVQGSLRGGSSVGNTWITKVSLTDWKSQAVTVSTNVSKAPCRVTPLCCWAQSIIINDLFCIFPGTIYKVIHNHCCCNHIKMNPVLPDVSANR